MKIMYWMKSFNSVLLLNCFDIIIYLYSCVQLKINKYIEPYFDIVKSLYYTQKIVYINKEYKPLTKYRYFMQPLKPEDSLKETNILMKIEYNYVKPKIFTYITLRKECSLGNYFSYNPIYYTPPIYYNRKPTEIYFIDISFILDKDVFSVNLTHPYCYYVNNNVFDRFFFVYYLLDKYPILTDVKIMQGKLELLDNTFKLQEICFDKDFQLLFNDENYEIQYK